MKPKPTSPPQSGKASRHREAPRPGPRDELRLDVVLFRFGVIAELLAVPAGSRRTRMAVSTIHDCLALCREGGFEALKPKPCNDGNRSRGLPAEVTDLLVKLKETEPAAQRARDHPADAPGRAAATHSPRQGKCGNYRNVPIIA